MYLSWGSNCCTHWSGGGVVDGRSNRKRQRKMRLASDCSRSRSRSGSKIHLILKFHALPKVANTLRSMTC